MKAYIRQVIGMTLILFSVGNFLADIIRYTNGDFSPLRSIVMLIAASMLIIYGWAFLK